MPGGIVDSIDMQDPEFKKGIRLLIALSKGLESNLFLNIGVGTQIINNFDVSLILS